MWGHLSTESQEDLVISDSNQRHSSASDDMCVLGLYAL